MISERENRKNISEILEKMRRSTLYESCGKDCKIHKAGITHSERCRLGVVLGSRWTEVDPRIDRIVEVVKIVGDRIHIKTLRNTQKSRIEGWTQLLQTGHVTVASLKRFNGKSRGYRILGMKCHKCQLALGAVVPKGGHRGITVSLGTCGVCLSPDSTLVPSCDYHWPKEGRKAVFD